MRRLIQSLCLYLRRRYRYKSLQAECKRLRFAGESERAKFLKVTEDLKKKITELESSDSNKSQEIVLLKLSVDGLNEIIERDRQRVVAEKAIAIAEQSPAAIMLLLKAESERKQRRQLKE